MNELQKCTKLLFTKNNIKQSSIKEEHINRLSLGPEEWNKWANNLLDEINNLKDKFDPNNYLIDFRGYTFTNEDFSDFIFPINVDFSNSCFNSRVSFKKTKFLNDVSFNGVSFNTNTSFIDVLFKGNVTFWQTNFNNFLMFQNTEFFKKVQFYNITLSKGAVFIDLKVRSDVIFKNVIFEEHTKFSNIISNSQNLISLLFKNSDFKKLAEFEKINYKVISSAFINTNFRDHVSFKELEVSSLRPLDFISTVFETRNPTLDELSYNIKELQNNTFNVSEAINLESKYRKLKQLAEQNNDHAKASEFYACELYCQRKSTKNWKDPKVWLNWCYDEFSGYGLSLWKPVRLWFISLILGIALQTCFDHTNSFSTNSNFNLERALFYASPSLPSFLNENTHEYKYIDKNYAKSEIKEPKEEFSFCHRLIRIVQKSFSFIALFLFGLAIRNRFKIK